MLLVFSSAAFASGHLEFTLHKLGPDNERVMLVIAGIQGDEPGGFNAANLLVSHYRITKGAVLVVPNLNFLAIVRSKRGVYGDLNRKFAMLQTADPDYETIRRIKAVILDPRVELVINMHDGSGYYRPNYIDSMRNPLRWGQSVIIDQAGIPVQPYGDLLGMAQDVCNRVNTSLYDPEHALHVKNTQTRLGDVEMEKTLTYFSINHGKPAFGIEASKFLPSAQRAYYHLQMLESFMRTMGIEFERSFPLSQDGVAQAIESNMVMAFYGNKIFLDLEDVRDRLGYVPLRKGATIEFTPSNPLLTMVGGNDDLQVYYGNNHLTTIHPQYFEYDYSMRGLDMRIDDTERHVPFGAIVSVGERFRVLEHQDCRVNVIGYTHPRQENETGLDIRRQDIQDRFSVNNAGDLFRVEVYKKGKFAGMVLVRFDGGTDMRLSSKELPPASETAVRRKIVTMDQPSTAMVQTTGQSKSR